MKNCCRHTKNCKICKRKDGKLFNLPRKFSRKDCLTKEIRGFTMRSSCAPYKYCQKSKKKKKKNNKKKSYNKRKNRKKNSSKKINRENKGQKNIYGKPLQICSKQPLTGWTRSGYCIKREEDGGAHTVCAKMDNKFLEYTKNKGNDLSSVVKEGENWCICENRYLEAKNENMEPKIIPKSTNYHTHLRKV